MYGFNVLKGYTALTKTAIGDLTDVQILPQLEDNGKQMGQIGLQDLMQQFQQQQQQGGAPGGGAPGALF